MNTDDVQPNYMSDRRLPLSEGYSQSNIDYLIRIGLGKDPSKLVYYRKAMVDPKNGVNTQYLRPYTAEILKNLLDMVLTDSLLWNRVKTLLLRKSKSTRGLTEDISEDGLQSLIEKSIDSEIPLEILFQVYSRGAALREHYMNKSGEQLGFNRVNSFIAGGRARYDDADLFDKEVVEHSDNENKKTLSLVKRVLRESKERK